MASPSRITVPAFAERKSSEQKLCMLTAYDFPTAQLLDQSGVDAILVGDSLANVVQGRETTIPVTLDEIIYHAEIVCRAVEHALVVVDMPFLSYHTGIEQAIANAGRILKQTGCQAVKLEGNAGQAAIVSSLVDIGIPVMAHVGLRPQSIHQMGGYRVQRDRETLLRDAQAAQDAGAFAVVLECLPVEVARDITEQIRIPTIGIGAGNGCDGQVLVTHDMLGLTSGYAPRFVRQFANLRETARLAIEEYCQEVRTGNFPGNEQSYQ